MSRPSPARRLERRPHTADLDGFVADALTPAEPVLVGVSGGGDSMALLLLLAPVARAQGRRLIAGIVDHALREGSSHDAARAAALAAELGAETRVLRVAWPAGPRPAQAHARTARYAALAALARALGARTLFLGHTLDDQAETILMRQQAGSGPRGLAGMAPLSPCPVWPEGRDLRLARPFLGRRRADLRDVLRAARAPWLEDPANALVRYARVRARADLARSGAADALADAAREAAALAAEADSAAAGWLAGAQVCDHAVALAEADLGHPAAPLALATLAASAGGALSAPTEAAGRRLAAQLARTGAATLSGAAFRRRAGRLLVDRDPGGLHGRRGGVAPIAPLDLPAGVATVWDRRLELTAPGPGWRADRPEGAGGPRLRHAGTPGADPAAARWLVRDRVAQLLWRANCSLFTAA